MTPNRNHIREFDPSELEEVMRSAFADVEIVGIRGSETMSRIELERVARARRLARLDRLGLRYRIPESLDNRLRIARRRRSRGSDPAVEQEVGVEHVRLSRGNAVATSLDLLAVGRP